MPLRLSKLVPLFLHVKNLQFVQPKIGWILVKAVHFVSSGTTPPYKDWREKSNAMLSWCPTEGALPPGVNESRGGLLPVDIHV